MPASPTAVLIAAALWLAASAAHAQGFSFSTPDDSAKREQEAREARITHDLSTPCRADLRNKKIMVVIGETQSNGMVAARQGDYGPHYRVINDRLRALGLTTYSAEEIRRQVAQAEIDAHFRNDPDAALSASRRLGASFILRGLIATRTAPNPMMRVNQVDVTMGFTLTSSSGKLISTADARSASYAGADTSRMALTLIEEQADEVVAKLYAEYCRNAGFEPAPAPATKRK